MWDIAPKEYLPAEREHGERQVGNLQSGYALAGAGGFIGMRTLASGVAVGDIRLSERSEEW